MEIFPKHVKKAWVHLSVPWVASIKIAVLLLTLVPITWWWRPGQVAVVCGQIKFCITRLSQFGSPLILKHPETLTGSSKRQGFMLSCIQWPASMPCTSIRHTAARIKKIYRALFSQIQSANASQNPNGFEPLLAQIGLELCFGGWTSAVRDAESFKWFFAGWVSVLTGLCSSIDILKSIRSWTAATMMFLYGAFLLGRNFALATVFDLL